MHRVQQPMLSVSSSLSCDCSIGVCSVSAMIRVRVLVRAGLCAGTPLFSFLFFLLCLLLLLTATDTTTMRVDHCYACVVMMYACTRCVCTPMYVQPIGTRAIEQHVCVDHFY